MKTIDIELTDNFSEQLVAFAERQGISVNRFIATATTERVSAMAEEYLSGRSQKASKASFQKVLNKVANVEAMPEDKLT